MLRYTDTQQGAAHFGESGKSDGKGWFYKQKETGHEVRSLCFETLKQKIHSHRMGMIHKFPSMDVEAGWMDRLEDEMCREGWNQRDCQDRDHPGMWKDKLEETGRKLWAELHAFALHYPKQPDERHIKLAKEWLQRWEEKIPSYDCPCKKNYDNLTNEIPAKFGSRREFYSWTVEIHNRVTQKIRHGAPSWEAPDAVMVELG